MIKKFFMKLFRLLFSHSGSVGEKLKYGHIKGGEVYLDVPIGASEVIKAASGRFVKSDGSGRVEIAGASDTEIVGFLEYQECTTPATEGEAKGAVNVARDAVYRIPINAGTYTASMRFKTCDLSVSGNIQGADLTASTTDVLIIVDGDADNNKWVDVMINPNKMGATGVV